MSDLKRFNQIPVGRFAFNYFLFPISSLIAHAMNSQFPEELDADLLTCAGPVFPHCSDMEAVHIFCDLMQFDFLLKSVLSYLSISQTNLT